MLISNTFSNFLERSVNWVLDKIKVVFHYFHLSMQLLVKPCCRFTGFLPLNRWKCCKIHSPINPNGYISKFSLEIVTSTITSFRSTGSEGGGCLCSLVGDSGGEFSRPYLRLKWDGDLLCLRKSVLPTKQSKLRYRKTFSHFKVLQQ